MCAALAIMSLVSVPAFADPAPTVLHLDQTAEQTVPRDELTVEIRAEATGANPGQVQAEVNRRMAAALAKVKAVAAVKAASGNYQTYQITPTGPDGKPKPPQWHTVQNLALTSRDFTAALDLTGRLQADGLTVGSIQFDVAPDTLRARQQALTDEALNELTERARQIAATLRLDVARIENLRVGNISQPGGGPRPMMMARAAAGAAPLPPAVEAGDTTISVTIGADIALMPK